MPLETTTSFLGMTLATPLLVGACPLSLRPEIARQMVDAGAGALVLPSVFEEQIEHDHFNGGSNTPLAPDRFPVSLTFDDAMNAYNGGLSNYLDIIERIRVATSVPIIANINGVGGGRWLSFAKKLEDAGADAIEVSLFRVAMDPDEFADDIEQEYLDGIAFLCGEVNLPVTVKLQPYFTSLPNFACRIAGAGAAGLTLFGRYPRCDGDLGRVNRRLHWGLTAPGDTSLSLQWLNVIRSALPKLQFAASGGVTTGEDAIRLMQSGADVVMVTSEIYRTGAGAIRRILEGMRMWARENERESFSQLVGEACHSRNTFDQAYERADATRSLTNASRLRFD